MTIINYASDGLYPELIVIFRVVAHLGSIDSKSIFDVCYPGVVDEPTKLVRLRGALSRWTELGLFEANNGVVKISEGFQKGKRETVNDFAGRLPSFCRTLLLDDQNCLPLWGESQGVAADFVRGGAWLLAQDIYGFPTAWSYVEPKQNAQTSTEKKISENDVRWNGLRFWMRYLGFATGDSGSFQIDPTVAIKAELKRIFESRSEIPAREFLDLLATRLPILDFGRYRKEVEENLNSTRWRKPAEGHLSMSLSLALRRLALDNILRLEGRADAGSSYRLTGRDYRSWVGFESVRWNGDKA
jgi:hypothetical protein